MNRCRFISYVSAAALVFQLCGCTVTKYSPAPKSQTGNSSVATNNGNSGRAMVASAQPQPASLQTAGKQVSAGTNRTAPLSPTASSQNVAKPQAVNTNRAVVIQSSIRNSVAPAKMPAAQVPLVSVPKEDVSELHFSGPNSTTTTPLKPRSFKWKNGVLISVGVFLLGLCYARRQAGSKSSKSSLGKPSHIPITDFPNQ